MKIFSVLAIILFAFPSYALELAELTSKLPDDKVLGKTSAKITLIEYASLSCPHCADFHNRVLPAIQAEYIDTGKIRFIYRDFPLNAPALMGSQTAHCIGKNDDAKYYAVVKKLFEEQKSWVAEEFKDKLAGIAQGLGMDAKAFEACVSDKALETKILTSRQNGDKMGVQGTPSFFVNGEKAEIHSPEDARKVLNTVLSGKTLGQEAREIAKKITVARPDDMVLGQDKAKVTVVEYSSFSTCPHCGAFHKNMMAALQKDYIDTGKVKVVYRGLPMNSAAFYAYMIAYCKGKKESFNVLSLLVDDIQSWANTPAFIAPLRAVGEKAGLSKEQFGACMENKEIESLVLNNMSEAREKLGIKGSPYVYVNGEQVVETESPEAVIKAVDAALKGKK